MARSYEYAILQAVPDNRRGERVNVGVVVLKSDGLDVQVYETRKLQALTGEPWDAYIESFTAVLREIDDYKLDQGDRLARLALVQNQFLLSKTGWFTAGNQGAYDEMLRDIVAKLVSRPKQKRTKEEPTVVAEISHDLRAAAILASKEDELKSGKVLRSYPIEDGLEADFVQLNSKMHVASVLDLRANSPRLAQAALKAIVLDRARDRYEGNVHRIGVYAAAPARSAELRENIGLLSRYSDDLVNWEDRRDREGLKKMFYDAYNSHNPPQMS